MDTPSSGIFGHHPGNADFDVFARSGFHGPTKLCGGGAGIGTDFFGGGADDVVVGFAENTAAKSVTEEVFDAAIFTAVEGEDGDATSGSKAGWQLIEEGIEGGEFFVHRDAQGLENTAHGCLAFIFIKAEGQRGADRRSEGGGADLIGARESLREDFSTRFIGVIAEEGLKFRGGELSEHLAGTDAALGIHAHVEWAVVLEAEATRGIIELHAGAAEIREDDIGTVLPTDFRQGTRQTGEVHAFDDESLRRGLFTQAGFGALDLQGILIEAE